MPRRPRPAESDHALHHLGLQADAGRMLGRRRALQLIGGGALLAVVGCSGDDSPNSTGATDSTAASGGSATTGSGTDAIPEETAGPFPGDGSNGPNILEESGIVRSDIRQSIGAASGVAEGVGLQVQLSVFDASNGEPLAGAAVYVWHCDRDGRYSIYELEDQNYLRGVQETAADGTVVFRSIFPGCYPGRWPHIHFEVYPSLSSATTAGNKIATSQFALPEDVCAAAYAAAGYERSVGALEDVSLERDVSFSDGFATQLAAVNGSIDEGFSSTLVVPV